MLRRILARAGRSLLLAGLVLAAPGCVQGIVVLESDGGRDAEPAMDRPRPDTGTADSGPPDSETPDGGTPDSGAPDSGALDATTGDASLPPVRWSETAVPAGLRRPSAVWARSAFEIYVADDTGQVFRFDGSNWSFEWQNPGSGAIHAMWGTPGRVYFAGPHTMYYRTRGGVTGVYSLPSGGVAEAISGRDDSDVYIAGRCDLGAALYHYESLGADLALTWPNEGSIHAVLALPGTRVLVAGAGGRIFATHGASFTTPAIEWPSAVIPARITFEGAAVVGGRPHVVGTGPIVLAESADEVWRVAYRDNGTARMTALAARCGGAEDEAYAVGASTADGPILRYYSGEWAPAGVPPTYDLADVTCADPDLYVAVGTARTSSTARVVLMGRR